VDIYSYITVSKNKNMSNSNQVGVWMDANHAFVISKNENNFSVNASINCGDHDGATFKNEHVEQSKENQEQKKYFEEIASHISNAHSIYIVGPGKAQEQFKNFLEDYQNFNAKEIALGASDKISQAEMIELVVEHFGK
jgi:stalled ribosome rescue protein Dom34